MEGGVGAQLTFKVRFEGVQLNFCIAANFRKRSGDRILIMIKLDKKPPMSRVGEWIVRTNPSGYHLGLRYCKFDAL